jgi:hypothetical protein
MVFPSLTAGQDSTEENVTAPAKLDLLFSTTMGPNNGYDGNFQFIKEANCDINHRYFEPF